MVKWFIHGAIILSFFCLAQCSASLSQQKLKDYEFGQEALEHESYDEAIHYLQSYLESAPQDAHAHLQLGLAFLKKGRLREAVDEFKQSLQLNPDNEAGRSLIKKGIFDEYAHASMAGNHDRAMKYLMAHLTINPDDVDTHLMLAKNFIKMGNTRNAIFSLNRAASLDPNNPEVIELLDYFADGFH